MNKFAYLAGYNIAAPSWMQKQILPAHAVKPGDLEQAREDNKTVSSAQAPIKTPFLNSSVQWQNWLRWLQQLPQYPYWGRK